MSHHRIIRSVSSLNTFIEWLPDLRQHERFYLCLQARKKYMPSLSSNDKTQLKRFVASKQNLFEKINQLECPVGAYKTRRGVVIPDEAMALYININPRCLRKATFAAVRSMIDLIEKENYNPHAEVLSCIHKAKSRSVFVHFDIDRPTGRNDEFAPKSLMSPVKVREAATDVVGEEAVTVVETRGGCHLMVELEKVVSETKNWHPRIVERINSDQTGDLMIPVVGCCQGGFVPRFVSP